MYILFSIHNNIILYIDGTWHAQCTLFAKIPVYIYYLYISTHLSICLLFKHKPQNELEKKYILCIYIASKTYRHVILTFLHVPKWMYFVYGTGWERKRFVLDLFIYIYTCIIYIFLLYWIVFYRRRECDLYRFLLFALPGRSDFDGNPTMMGSVIAKKKMQALILILNPSSIIYTINRISTAMK